MRAHDRPAEKDNGAEDTRAPGGYPCCSRFFTPFRLCQRLFQITEAVSQIVKMPQLRRVSAPFAIGIEGIRTRVCAGLVDRFGDQGMSRDFHAVRNTEMPGN